MKTLAYLALLCLTLIGCNYQPESEHQPVVNQETHKDSLNREKRQTDSLIFLIKKDSLFEVKDAYYDAASKTLMVAFTNKGNIIKDHDYGTDYFEQTYHISNFDYLDGISLYAYKKRKHLNKPGDYHDPLISSSKSRDAYQQKEIDDFKEKLCSATDCVPLEDYIKKRMNDPDSYEGVGFDVKLDKDGNISVIQEFRGKNSFDATITQKAIATLLSDGTVIKCELY